METPSEDRAYLVAALYKFVPLHSADDLRSPLQSVCDEGGVVGTLLLAPEGINGTIAGPAESIERVLAFLRIQPGLEDLTEKRSYAPTRPFHRMKVRLKREIVTIGDHEIDPTVRVGTYVGAERFNELLDDPDVVVIDTRNVYETRVGTFEGAVDPGLESFREFPAWVKDNLDPARNRRVAMFCTGGIRCEKASSLLLREGFQEVFHLEGGILKYLETTPSERSRWRGECFVFDQRVSVDSELRPGRYALCFGCLNPVSETDVQAPEYEYGVTCPKCYADTTEHDRSRRRERCRQIELAEAEGRQHIGSAPPPRSSTAGSSRLGPSDPGVAPGGASSGSAAGLDGVLYSFRRCPYAMRARMALAAADFNPEIREVALKAKPPEMLALGCTTVPVLQLPTGDVLGQSLDIMNWVRRQRPTAMPVRSAPELDALLESIDGPFKFNLDRYKYPNRYPDEDTSGARASAVSVLDQVEAALQNRPYLDGEQPGFHDAAVFPFVRQFAGVDSEWFESLADAGTPKLPRLVAWTARMRAHAWFTRIMRKLVPWKAGDPPLAFQSTLVGTSGPGRE